ncbi:type II secretion system minor pseudopilin GspH [Granulosicoccaceae sp. 1_MG-2023]|nr:type II secretion system minor pseudopilin GspH [Granulosicoccaceae sp. 1_MG-2023]
MTKPFSLSRPGTAQRGFTLIEILVVIVVISVLSTMVVLNTNLSNRSKDIEEKARQLHQLIMLAADEAVFLQRELGLRLGTEGYSFYQLVTTAPPQEDDESDATEGQSGAVEEEEQSFKPYWVELTDDRRLRARDYPEDMLVELTLSGVEVVIEDPSETDIETFAVKPHIMILSNGEMMPDFSIRLADPQSDSVYVIGTGREQPVVFERLD